jgi:hypothetical protein
MYRSLARPCTRICARTNGFLLAFRVRSDFSENARFPFVKRLRFGNVKRRFKSNDLGFLSLRVCQFPGQQVLRQGTLICTGKPTSGHGTAETREKNPSFRRISGVGLRSFSLLSPAPGQYFGPGSQVPNCNRLATMSQARCKFGHWTCRNSSIISRTDQCGHTLILSLAVRRKGIARFADRRSLSVRVGRAVADSPTALQVVTSLSGFSGSNIFGQATISSLPNTAIIAKF